MTSELAPPARLTHHGVPIDPTLRVLALGTLVNRASGGAVFTTFALYFTRHVGLSAPQVGIALSIAAVAAPSPRCPAGSSATPAGRGRCCGRSPSSPVSRWPAWRCARSFTALVVVVSVVSAGQMAAGAVRNGYIARIASGGRGVRFKAYLRAVTNVAMTFGALVGGVALWIDEPWAYVAVFVLDGVVLGGHRPALRPASPPAADAGPWPRASPGSRCSATCPFVVATLLTAVLFMHFVVHRDRHPAVDQRAHRGADLDGGGDARPQHRGGRAVPGPDESRRRGRHDGRERRAARRLWIAASLRADRASPTGSPAGSPSRFCCCRPRSTWSAR